MNSRQLEADYKEELEKIHQKVRLGEISQEEGEFLLLQIKEKTRRKINRLKRPGRKIYYLLSLVFSSVFIYCFCVLYSDLDLHDLGLNDLYFMGISMLALLILFFFELKRVEKMNSRYFSASFFQRIIHSPEIEFEVQRTGLIQIQLELKNINNLFAGLGKEESWQLKTHILTTISSTFDISGVFFEEMGPTRFVISLPWENDEKINEALRKVEEVFTLFQDKSGMWFSKSVQVGASLVVGDFLCGNMGEHLQQHRSYGKPSDVGMALAQAAGWFEILIDEQCLDKIQGGIYFEEREPIFLRSLGSLVPVYSFLRWKEV